MGHRGGNRWWRWAIPVLAAVLLAGLGVVVVVDLARGSLDGRAGSAFAEFRTGAAGLDDPYFPGYGNGGYDVRHYALDLRYDPGSDRLEGHTVLDAVASHGLSRFNLDLGPLDVESVEIDGVAAADVKRTGDTELQVTPARGIAGGARFVVSVRYGGAPGGDAAKKRGFLRTADGALVVGEPESATDWYPSNDHPRDKATFDFAIAVPDGLTAVANGVPAGSTTDDGWTTWRWKVAEPMASYLASMAIGRFRVVTNGIARSVESVPNGRNGVPMFTAVASSIDPALADAAIARTEEIAAYLTTIFGPYPFGALGATVTDTPELGFALEVQTRPVYPVTFFRRGTSDEKTWVIAHELAHQWFGDSVSVNEWREIWLNEGFATYAQWMWNEHLDLDTAAETFDGIYNSSAGTFWSLPPGEPGKDDMFSNAVYNRGAMTVHALRMSVSEDAFRRILREWTAAHRYDVATTKQFIELAERVSGKQLGPLFDAWLYGTTRPAHPGRR